MSNPHSFKPLIPPPGGADDVDLLDEVANNPGLVMLALTPPVAFNPIFVDMTGSITAGLFLSMCLQEMEDGHSDGDWATLDYERVHRITRLSKAEFKGARERLRGLGLLEERRTGFPAQTHFRIKYERIKQLLIELSRRQPQPTEHGTQGAVLDYMH